MHRLNSIALPLIAASLAAIPTIPTIPTLRPAGPPTNGIVAAPSGAVYFVDSFHRTVWRLDPEGGLAPFVTGVTGRTLQVDEEGNVYGTNEKSAGPVMWRADCRGRLVELPHADVADHSHVFVVEGDGDVIASSGQGRRSGVRLWRASEHQRQLVAGGDMGLRDGSGSEARFLPIGSMTLTPDGDLLVTSGPTIRRVDPDGAVTTIAADEKLLSARSTFLGRLLGAVHGHLSGIAVSHDGDIFVANSARSTVVRIAPDGSAGKVVEAGHGWTPTGVAVVHDTLYVLEYGHGVRVRRVDPQGRVALVALIRPDRALAGALPHHPRIARG